MEALLAGPSLPLARAVTNAMPSGVTLGDEGAVIDAQGVVTVDMVGLSALLGDAARRRMGAQLIWSLSSLPGSPASS
ncbi:GerMN domain-containing protein [Tessaracoccus sp. HDW20]|nr:GerMN domain-containing protein [Tessaracoccus coleopterorum]